MLNIYRYFVLLLLSLMAASVLATTGPRVGETAPDFALTDLNNKSHSLADLRQSGHVLLVFWSTKCHVCHAMIPQFQAIHKKYDGKGLTLAAINVGFEDKDEVDDYVFEYKLNYLVLNEDDKKAELAQGYRLVGTPTIQLIAPDGTVKFRGHGIPDLDAIMAKTVSGR